MFEARSCASVQTLLLPASGILNDTGFQFVQVIRMFRQLHLFEEYQLRVRRLVGVERTQKLVSQSIVLITVCGNDFVNNYLLVSNLPRSGQFLIPEYVLFLIPEYKKLFFSLFCRRRLYNLGARRVLVMGTGPLGCVPAELALRSRNRECSAELQQASELHNPQLRQMLNELNRGYDADIFIYADCQIRAKFECCGQGPYDGLVYALRHRIRVPTEINIYSGILSIHLRRRVNS
ncbi:hypothetical protein MLD38_029673 [Melastoma candidum]|uniref:Uncharacterized protein n=1 Tax=Melastoma candidum TaxID=119954 RepID=A0ACB9N8M3_9MYRT|nr:hypothetical protein MLD38_029673 [Melastoma candidum]